MQREAMPGAMRIPAGAKDRERFEVLEARMQALASRVDALESAKKPGRPKKDGEAE